MISRKRFFFKKEKLTEKKTHFSEEKNTEYKYMLQVIKKISYAFDRAMNFFFLGLPSALL